MMDPKPHAKLTSTLIVLLKLTLGITIIAVLAGIYDLYSYSNLPPDFDVEELLPTDIVSAIVGVVQFILAVVTSITFFLWVFRTNRALQSSDAFMAFTPGWSVGWFFIPIASLWKPYQVMKELWDASHQGTPDRQSIVGWWWTLYLVSNVIAQVAVRLLLSTDDPNGHTASTMAYLASDGIDVLLTVVELIMISSIGAAYARNYSEEAPPANEWSESMF